MTVIAKVRVRAALVAAAALVATTLVAAGPAAAVSQGCAVVPKAQAESILGSTLTVLTDRDTNGSGATTRTRGCSYKAGSKVVLGYDANTYASAQMAQQMTDIQKKIAKSHFPSFKEGTAAGVPVFTYTQTAAGKKITYIRLVKGSVTFAASVAGSNAAKAVKLAAVAVPNL